MPFISLATAVWCFFILPCLGQNQFSNFRHNCSTPSLSGTILTSPCRELCSWCFSFYVSSIDLNKCVGYDGNDSLMPKKDGNYGNQCKHCYTNWEEPDVLHCECTGTDGNLHEASLDLNAAVGTHCGRLSCQDYINDLGPPLATPESTCDVMSDNPSGQRKVPLPTSPPGLLYVRRGKVYRQFPSNISTSTTSSGLVSVIITLTVEEDAATEAGVGTEALPSKTRTE